VGGVVGSMKPGDRFIYNEKGMVAKVTLVSYELQNGSWHAFEFRVDKIYASEPLKDGNVPKPVEIVKVGYRDGYKHYAGWEIDRL